MKIYLVMIHYYYDESEVLGVYTTHNLATEELHKAETEHRGNSQVRIYIKPMNLIGPILDNDEH